MTGQFFQQRHLAQRRGWNAFVVRVKHHFLERYSFSGFLIFGEIHFACATKFVKRAKKEKKKNHYFFFWRVFVPYVPSPIFSNLLNFSIVNV